MVTLLSIPITMLNSCLLRRGGSSKWRKWTKTVGIWLLGPSVIFNITTPWPPPLIRRGIVKGLRIARANADPLSEESLLTKEAGVVPVMTKRIPLVNSGKRVTATRVMIANFIIPVVETLGLGGRTKVLMLPLPLLLAHSTVLHIPTRNGIMVTNLALVSLLVSVTRVTSVNSSTEI